MAWAKCKICGKNVEDQEKHFKEEHLEHPVEVVKAAQTDKKPVGKVRFISTAAPSLTVVVSPQQWTMVKTPVGEKMILVQGKSVNFVGGVYETEDPEIIDYLEKVYRDQRFPIISSRISNEFIAAARSREART